MVLNQIGQEKVNRLVDAIDNRIDSSVSVHDINSSAHETKFEEVDELSDLKINKFLDDLSDEIRKE